MRLLLVLSSILLLPFLSFAQSIDDVIHAEAITWFGLDLYNARFINSEAFEDPEDVKGRYFEGWNGVVANEPEKFDLKAFFEVPQVYYDLTIVKERNQQVDMSKAVVDKWPYSIPEENLQDIVNSYDLTSVDRAGIGLILIVESFNKPQKYGSGYVVFFDIESKNILWYTQQTGNPVGFGLRNYWVNSMFEVLEKSSVAYKSIKTHTQKTGDQ